MKQQSSFSTIIDSSKSIDIPEVTILRLNNWVPMSQYDQLILQAYRANDEYSTGMYDENGDPLHISSEFSDKYPQSAILCSGYEIECKDILEFKSLEGGTNIPGKHLITI